MNKYFGVPIILAFFLGYKFPFIALASSTLAFFILMLMMGLTFLTFDFSTLRNMRQYKSQLSMGLVSLFLFTPFLQWFLAHYLIHEESLSFGTFFASLCPIAIVSPMFTKHKKGNVELSFILMLLSTLLFPAFVFFHIAFFKNNIINLRVGPLLLDIFSLITFPVIFALVVNKFSPRIKSFLIGITPNFNMLAIAFMAFVYFGASTSKLNLYYTPAKEFIAIILIVIIQDFGIYFLSRWFFNKIYSREDAVSLSVSLGMKNIAISGSLLLFYDPKASLASAIGFLVHAFYYNFLSYDSEKNNLTGVSK